MIQILFFLLLIAASAPQRNGDLAILIQDGTWREDIDPHHPTTEKHGDNSKPAKGESPFVKGLRDVRQISNEVIGVIAVFSAIGAFIFGSIARCIYLYFRVANDPQLALGDNWLNLVVAFFLTFGANPQGQFGLPANPAVGNV